jgi:hypothetical protein
MEKVPAAHIHQGKEGQNGPVVVTLFKAENVTGTGSVNGQLVGGFIIQLTIQTVQFVGKYLLAEYSESEKMVFRTLINFY